METPELAFSVQKTLSLGPRRGEQPGEHGLMETPGVAGETLLDALHAPPNEPEEEKNLTRV